MITVKIKYRRLFIPGTATANLPQNWGEIGAGQLKAVVRLYLDQFSDLSFLSLFCGLNKRILKSLSDFERFKLMELVEFIGTHKPHHQFIIRKIRPSVYFPALLAPEDKLRGVTFGQFIFADSYFSAYQETKDRTDLNKFIAALYLKKNESFSEKLIDKRFQQMNALNENTCQAILINYQLIHEWLTLAYPLIFQKVKDQVDTEKTESKSRNPNVWIRVFQNFVGNDIIHDHLWAEKPVNTIFAYMTRKYKENAKSK